MAVTPVQLRADFIEFANVGTYPDATIAFWVAVAGRLLRAEVWTDMLDFATELFVCHQLTVAARNTRSATAGGIPGQSVGVLTSKAVDKASAAYDVSKVTLDNAGFYNLSSYGIQFFQLAQSFGAGGVQL